jgi:hypothetical protein
MSEPGQSRVYRSGREFEEEMFPNAVAARAAAAEPEEPSSAGRRLAEEALARVGRGSRRRTPAKPAPA